ncbi:UDP-N-acetyl glucosamine 2-epimerase [Campylobacter sp. LR264d]|nr:UDP-N-acetyl glucosamine 2-epimerase [Campylobacter sp. LR196d]KAA6228664.1 UDP-N-acetyl glucosamine 2-epimerase [Campylobacter sp. LR185c]KAA6229067.1 UDP-N-acetyl glucosamine 2-epimerase [Campylobacter sp. LR286c]KAA6233698.1 UDP-N-acetyl glucosamine 2-epimerase [Campylobacter sp. LR264d]
MIFEPFPKEAIRVMISKIANLHFAPTKIVANALKKKV